MDENLTHGSLFSGIGGFDYAAELMGWQNLFHCEKNTFCQRILKYYWPQAASHDDIKTTDFKVYRGLVDVLSGGFPCQPYSTAGKRKGKEDERHLWPQMLRAVREISPRYVVGENVRGLTNWNGGLVFDEVQADLEAEGYEVLPFLLPACGVNAPHRRDRIWFIAKNTDSVRRNGELRKNEPENRKQREYVAGAFEWLQDVANTDGWEREAWMRERKCENKTETRTRLDNRFTGLGYNESGTWECFPTQPPVCGGDDGIPRELDGITFPRWRRESIQAYGNAIVPQVVLQVFRTIQKMVEMPQLGNSTACPPKA